MTANADAPRPALGELARRAEAVIEQNGAKNALPYGSQERNDANRVLLQLIVDFREAASPEAILQLVALASGGAADVPTDLIHEADGLLSLVAHRYRVHEIPRDVCDELIACSNRLRRIGQARKVAASPAQEATPPRDWSGVWNNWIAPFHACPRCGASLNWKQGEDALERPLISASHCGVYFSAPMTWRAE